MEKVRFGIIGLGNQGTHYTLDLFGKGVIKNGYITALCDNNPAKINIMKEKNEDKAVVYFEDYIEMLDSGLVDAVVVETPHYQHPEIVTEALKRNIHVICDKPAGVYTKQVREMNEIAKQSSAKFTMLFNQRTNCVYRKLKELIEQSAIGKLQRMTWKITVWFRPQCYYDSGSWRGTWQGEGGGVLINQCPHQIDLMHWVLGEMPTSVRAFCHYGKWHDIEVEDDVTAYFEFPSGMTGVFITSTGETPGVNRLEISGTKGMLVVENDKLRMCKLASDSQETSKTAKVWTKDIDCEWIDVETDGENPKHAGIINNFANALLGTEELFVPGTEGIKMVELMNAMELSGWNDGEKIILPVDEERYLKELNAHRAVSRFKISNDDVVLDVKGSFN